MNFEKLSKRASLYSLQYFLKHGDEAYRENTEKKYSQRLEETDEKAEEILKNKCSDPIERERMRAALFDITCEYEDIYFEIGLLLGTKMGLEIKEKMEEFK